jgi:hypothetical protein
MENKNGHRTLPVTVQWSIQYRPNEQNKNATGPRAPVAFDRLTKATEAGQAHSAYCLRGQRPMQLSFVRLRL